MKCTSPPGTRHLLPLTRHPPPATGGKVICSALCNVIAWWFKLERRRCRQKERHLKPFLHYSSLLIWLNCKIVFRDWKNCRVFTFHTQPHNGSLHVVHKTRTAAHKNENMPAQNEQKLQIFKIFNMQICDALVTYVESCSRRDVRRAREKVQRRLGFSYASFGLFSTCLRLPASHPCVLGNLAMTTATPRKTSHKRKHFALFWGTGRTVEVNVENYCFISSKP